MATILLKRGLQTNIDNLTLQEGELALAYNSDKTKIALYAGDGKGGIVLINPDVTVPAKVSELTNDSGFQTATDVSTAISTAIAATGHASFKKVDSVPAASAAEDNVLYLVMNSETSHYDIYAKVGSEVVLLDDTTVDLSGYATTTALNNKVDKVSGKGLSTEDYTTAEKSKLSGLSNYSHPTYTAKSSGLYKVTVDGTGHVSGAAAVEKSDITGLGIPAQDTTYSAATTSAAGLMSSSDKSKLDGIATGANKTTVDTALSATSTNPVQNKVVQAALDGKIGTDDVIDCGTFSSSGSGGSGSGSSESTY